MATRQVGEVFDPAYSRYDEGARHINVC